MPFIVTEVSPAGAAEITDFDCRRPTSAADMEALRAAFRQPRFNAWSRHHRRRLHQRPARIAVARVGLPVERQARLRRQPQRLQEGRPALDRGLRNALGEA